MLNTVTLKWDLADLIQAGLSATLSITPTAQLSDTTDHVLIPPVARTYTFSGGSGQLAGIVANDNSAILPAGTGYLISVTAANGQVIVPQFQTQLLYANGAVQWLDALATVPSVTTSYQYLPQPSGTPSAGQVPAATGVGEESAWKNISGLLPAVGLLQPSGDSSGATDAAAIQAIWAAGLSVQLQAGTYWTNATLVRPAGLGIAGAGDSATTVKAADSTNLVAVIADAAWYDNASAQQNGGYCRDLTIDGNAANQATYGIANQAGGHGLVTCAVRCVTERVYFTGCPVDGYVQSDVNKAGSTLTGVNVECHITDCWADSCGRDGFHILFNSPTNGNTDGWLENCASFNNGRWNFNLETCAGWFVNGNHAWTTSSSGSVMAHSFHFGQVWGTFIHDNEVDTFGSQGFGATTDSSASGSASSTTITLPAIGNKYLDGFSVTDTNIPSGTTIVKALGSNQYQMSAAATGTVTSATVTPNYYGFDLQYIISGRPSSFHHNQAATAEYETSANYYYATFSVAGSVSSTLIFSGNTARKDIDRSSNTGAISVGYNFIAPAGSSLIVPGAGNVTQDGVSVLYQTGGGGTFSWPTGLPGASLETASGLYGDHPNPGAWTLRPDCVNAQNIAMVSGNLMFTYFTAPRTEQVTQVAQDCMGVAASGVTYFAWGLYTVDTVTGNLTRVASTPNDTTLFASTFTTYFKSFSAAYTLQAGQRYALGLLGVATGMPNIAGNYDIPILGYTNTQTRKQSAVSGQSSLPASVTSGITNANAQAFCAQVLP